MCNYLMTKDASGELVYDLQWSGGGIFGVRVGYPRVSSIRSTSCRR
jgi:hypothetical protein